MIKRCEQCGKEFVTFPRSIKKGHGRFCSLKCFGLFNRSDKSIGEYDGFNVYVATNGYAKIVFGRSKEQLFHVYLMEKTLGRKLLKDEHVHHINQNRLDNRLENLQIVNNCGGHQREHANIRIRTLGGTPGVHKYCPACDRLLLLESFPNAKSTYDGKHGFCKQCACARVRAYNAANRDKINEQKRRKYADKKLKELE